MQEFTGKQYLQMDIAANYGNNMDKALWSERLKWFEENQHQLRELVKTAEEPALFYAGITAWEDTQNGIPSGYPISLDATCSGLQLLAVLTGDRSAARLCNVISTGSREDAYTYIYQYMVAMLGEVGQITRAKTKDAIMTAFYGSQAVPKEVFGKGKLLGIFYDTMKTLCPAAWKLNELYLMIWNPNVAKYSLVFPDNFHAHLKVMTQIQETVHFLNKPYDVFKNVNAPMEGGRSLGANTNHGCDGMVVREMGRRCNYNPKVINYIRSLVTCPDEWTRDEKLDPDETELLEILLAHYAETKYLSARIFDCITINNIHLVPQADLVELLESLPAKPFEVISVHDCFRCLPNYGNDLRKQYNRQLYLIARSDLLSSLLSQLMGSKQKIAKLDPNMFKDILSTDYALS